MPQSLPCVLAGPILRQTDRNRLSIWLCTSGNTNLRLTVSDPENGSDILGMVDVKSLKAAPSLYYHLISFKPDSPLTTDYFFNYHVEYEKDDQWHDIAADDPDLLYDGQSALCFQVPEYVQSLLHGSCRKPHHNSPDGLLQADLHVANQIKDKESAKWPSFLVMTGDQIYADDVAAPMLRAIHLFKDMLSAPTESFESMELDDLKDSNDLYGHENCYFGRTNLLPKVDDNKALVTQMFKGVKKPVFTTITAQNHLISLMENLIMYLMVWSPVPWRQIDLDIPDGLSAENRETYVQDQRILSEFVSGLGQVRRVMAHLPVAMIFDDHDVTDDWNLNREWEETVYNHPFSCRMVCNSLTAYFINQGWGNNPDGFDPAFLKRVQTILDHPGGDTHQDYQEKIIAFEGWEYEWDASPPLVVIDTRTRRWRSETSAIKPSGLLDWEALVELQHRLFDHKSVLLIAPAPIFGVKLIENIQRLFTWFGKPLLVDAENWMAHRGTANSILNIFRHRNTPQNFTILSGDVHYSFVYDVELRHRKGGPDIWQITSSGFKNEFPPKLLATLDVINRWLFSPKSPLNWLTKRRRMRIVPRKPEGHPDGHRLLNGSRCGLVEFDQDGKPTRMTQLLYNGDKISFDRMEDHSRWE